VDFEVECGSGTYIRAIARDVGESLGVGGHLLALRRTKVGAHPVERALSPDALGDPDRVRDALIAPLDAVADMPRMELDEAGAAAVGHGRTLVADPHLPTGVPIALAHDGRLAAIGERLGEVIRPRKVFPPEPLA
jgi:tRNA pseudouridine55 synthase